MTVDASQVRAFLGERIPTAGSDSDTMFTDNEIEDLIELGGTLFRTVTYGWMMKAAELARLIDIAESGSDRKLSQRFNHAQMQLKFFQARVDEEQALTVNSARVPGRSFALYDTCCVSGPGLVKFTETWNRFRERRSLANGF